MWASNTPDKQCRTQFISKIGSEFINRLGILLYQVLWNWFKRLLNIAFGLYQIHNLLEFWKDIYLMRCIVFEVVTKVNKKLSGMAGFFLSLLKTSILTWTFGDPNFLVVVVIAQIGFFSNRIKCNMNKQMSLSTWFVSETKSHEKFSNTITYTRWLGVKILHIQIGLYSNRHSVSHKL